MIKKIIALFLSALFIFLIVTLLLIKDSGISITAGTSGQLKNDSGRTNFLLLGVDKRDFNTFSSNTLTDTLMIGSLDFNKKDIKVISIPRDFWVDYESYKGKINNIYSEKGLTFLKNVLEEELGIKINYHALVEFDAFINAVDIVGGVNINNPVSFTDKYYPIFGMENNTCGLDEEGLDISNFQSYDFPCRFETISFNEGIIKLSGEDALKYIRSRYSNESGNDFNRSNRQQLVIKALKDKLLTKSILGNPTKLPGLYKTFSSNVDTDISLQEIILATSKITDYNTFTFESAVVSPKGTNFIGSDVLKEGGIKEYGAYVLIEKETNSLKNFFDSFLYSSTNSNLDNK